MQTNKKLFGSVVAVAMVALLGAQLLTARAVGGHVASNYLGDGGANPTATSLFQPRRVVFDSVNQRLFVADTENGRILVYNTADGYTDGEPAVNVLGQSNFTTRSFTISASIMIQPSGLAYDSVNQRLFAADGQENRVLVFDVTTIADGEPAVNVLGQGTFTGDNANWPTFTLNAMGVQRVNGVAYDPTGQRLFVTDFENNRILVFDVLLITNGEAAVNVLGAPDFITSGTTAATPTSVWGPQDVSYDPVGQRLFVADYGNQRVTVFDVVAITNGEPAVNVLGQPNLTSSGQATTATGMSGPMGVAHDAVNQRLFVADINDERVLVYDVLLITNGEAAVDVFGKNDFTSSGGLPQFSVVGVAYDASSDTLAVTEGATSRVLLFSPTGLIATPTPTPGPAHNNVTFMFQKHKEAAQPVAGSDVRIYNTDDPAFRAAYGNQPHGNGGWLDQMVEIYEYTIGRVSSCVTDVNGSCTANKPAPGNYLTIGQYDDVEASYLVYIADLENAGNFEPSGTPGEWDAYVNLLITRKSNPNGFDYKPNNLTRGDYYPN